MNKKVDKSDVPAYDLRIVVPEDLEFSQLQLRVGRSGEIQMEREPLRRVCEASGVDPELFFSTGSEQNLAHLILGWYQVHLARGGRPNAILEENRALLATSH